MRIGIDLDDTITNSSDVFVEYAKKYNCEKSITHEININELDQQIAFGWDSNNQKEFREKYLRNVLLNAKPNKDVIETLNDIWKSGNEIVIITARSDKEIKDMEKITKEWLKTHDIKYNKLIMGNKEKDQICVEEKIDVFIDDNVDFCKKVYERLKIPVFLYSTRYNLKANIDGLFRVYNWKEISKKASITKPLEYIDVYDKAEYPEEREGYRYIHFYGGTKNYRAYIAPYEISRADFMETYPEYVPEQNRPIYENDGIIVRADPKYPCPGFYIFGLNKTYRAFDLLDDITFLRFCFILKKIKEGMRSELNINYAHLLSNEKSDPFVNVHFWLVPVNGITSPDLLDFDVKKYLEEFKPSEEIDKVLYFNKKLKDYISKINLVEQDNNLKEKLSKEKSKKLEIDNRG